MILPGSMATTFVWSPYSSPLRQRRTQLSPACRPRHLALSEPLIILGRLEQSIAHSEGFGHPNHLASSVSRSCAHGRSARLTAICSLHMEVSSGLFSCHSSITQRGIVFLAEDSTAPMISLRCELQITHDLAVISYFLTSASCPSEKERQSRLSPLNFELTCVLIRHVPSFDVQHVNTPRDPGENYDAPDEDCHVELW